MTSLLPLEPYNPFEGDPVLRRAVELEGAGSLEADLLAFGARVGSEEVFQWGFDANRYGPELITHSPFGERIDEIRYHPSYQVLFLSFRIMNATPDRVSESSLLVRR